MRSICFFLLTIFLCQPAGAVIPEQFIGPRGNSFSVPGGLEAVAKYISAHEKLLESEAMALLSVTIRHTYYANENAENLPKVLHQLLDRFPHSNDVLEGVVESIYHAEKARNFTADGGSSNRLPGAKEVLRRVEQLASPQHSDNVFFHLAQLYHHFPDLQSEPEKGSLSTRGVVKTGSSYKDGKKTIQETGSGTLVSIPRLSKNPFLLTASHLLDGKEPWVQIEGVRIKIEKQNSLLNNDNDLGLVELKGVKAQTALNFSETDQSFHLQPAFAQSLNLNHLPIEDVYNRYDYLKYDQTQQGLGDHSYLRYRVVHPPWAVSNLNDIDLTSDRILPPELVSEGEQVHLYAKTSPGMSGTILLANDLDQETRVAGVLTQYNYYFSDSYFASEKVMVELVNQFAQGKRGRTNDTAWEMKNSLTYRNFGGRFRETNFISAPSGNGVSGDPGNGVAGDPGNGVGGDPGLCIRKDRDENLGGISRLATLLKDSSPYAIFGIRPGIQWDGKAVIGIRAVSKTVPHQTFLLYANTQAINFMQKHALDYNFESVALGEDLMPFAREKLLRIFGKTPSKELRKEKILLKGSNPNYWLGATAEFSRNEIKLSLVGDQQSDPQAVLVLDAKGRKKGESQFLPIVEASSGKNKFVVDLRQLYFTDLSDVAQHAARNDELPKAFSEALTAYNESIQVPYRNEDTGMERMATFLPMDCSDDLGKNLPDGSSSNWRSAGRYSRSLCESLKHK